MKNIINVSIAGIAFKLDEEAYALLDNYLQKIRSAYGNSPEGSEILNDIEARIAEVILTRQEMSETVNRPLIEDIISRLGSPEDISEASGNPENQEEQTTHTAPEQRIPHRLYRNSEGAKFGGVCSGLAAYFNTDPVIIRLLFAAPLILLIFFSIVHLKWVVPMMSGLMTTSFILYFLLWIVIPKAKTPLQKLEMKGEKFTKDKIEQTFREEFQSRSNDPRNIELRARNERNASIFSEFISIIGKIMLFFAKALVAVIGFSLIIAIVAIIGGLIFIFLEGNSAVYGINATSPALLVALICIAVLLPVSLIVYGILKFLFGFRHNKPLVTTVMVIWLLTLVFGTVIFIKDSENISFGDKVSLGWSSEGDFNEKEAQWDDQEVDMDNLPEASKISETKGYYRHSDWKKFALASDSLAVVPAAESDLIPDGFVLKIRRGNPKYPDPVIVNSNYVSKKRKKDDYANRASAEYEIRNDSLFLRVEFPKRARDLKEKSEIELFLPENIELTVDEKINYNEYFRTK